MSERSRWFNEEFLKNNYQFVLSFDNIIDYTNWRNLMLKYGYKNVKKALNVWENIKKRFEEVGWVATEKKDATYVLGGVFDGEKWRYRLLSNKPVKIPHMPSLLLLESTDGTLFFEPTNRKLYVQLLKSLIKAVIVRV